MKKRYLIPIVVLSVCFVSATTYGVVRLVQNNIPGDEPRANPLVILSAKDAKNGYVGKFASGDDMISRTVRRGTTWGNYKLNMPTPTLSGYDLKGWQVSLTGIDGSWSNINDSFVFNQNTYLRVSEWGSAEASSFASDSWATLVNEASKGLASLKSVYYDDLFKNHPEYNNSFIIQNYSNDQEVAAKTRIVNLKGIGDFRVRVIGEDQDIIAGSANKKVAVLTFEFVDAVEPALGYSKGTDTDSWTNSYIKYYLDNSFLYRLPDPINRTDVLQTVVKKTLTDGPNDTRIVRESNERLFIPSISELGYRRVLDGSSEEGHYQPISNVYVTPTNEGNAYEFYRINTNNDKARIKYYDVTSGSEPISYWTRSPFEKEATFIDRRSQELYKTHCVHAIDSYGESYPFAEGGVSSHTTVNGIANAIAPCFCIGQDDAYKLSVTFDKGTDVIARADSTITNNNVAKIQLFDKRDMTAPVYNVAESATKPLFEITSGGVALSKENYYYDAGMGLLTINTTGLSDDVSVKVLASQTHGEFETDSWETIVSEANKGFDSLKTKYATEFEANGGTFIGLKRKIELNYTYALSPDILEPSGFIAEHYVRVIGENNGKEGNGHDKYDDGGTLKDLSLTFTFTEGLGTIVDGTVVQREETREVTEPIPIACAYGFAENPLKYTDSDLKDYLTNSERLISAFPDALTDDDGIRPANKKVGELNDDGTYSLSTFNHKLFALSYEEIMDDTDLIPISGEGTIYPYYELYGAEVNMKIARELLYSNWSFDHYWLRSISTNKTDALTVNAFTGQVVPYKAYDFDDPVAVSVIPAFALGLVEE